MNVKCMTDFVAFCLTLQTATELLLSDLNAAHVDQVNVQASEAMKIADEIVNATNDAE